MVLAEDGWCGRVGVRDFLNAPEVLNMRLAATSTGAPVVGRRDLASALRATGWTCPGQTAQTGGCRR